MYVILGCGGVGARAAELLREAGKEVHLVDRDATRVEALRERRFHVVQSDMRQLDFRQAPYKDADAYLVLARDEGLNMDIVRAIKKAVPDAHVIARSRTTGAGGELRLAGANTVILAADVVANNIVKELADLELVKRTDALVNLIREAGDGGLGIFLHDSPDPDSIAGGMALQRIAEHLGVKSYIYYGGRIGHQQNRTLVNLLGVRMKQVTPDDDVRMILRRHPKTAIIDCEIAGQNNVLPRDHIPSIVIGHHSTSVNKAVGEFVDVRQNVGAVSTIVLGYLQELQVSPDARLATALMHGIRVDTAGLTRNTSPSDLKAVAYLSSVVDPKLLEQITSPPMTSETLDVMGRAIVDRHQRGAYMATNAGYITMRDSLPQAADFLLNLEGVSTVLVFGIQGDLVHLSARSRDTRINVGEVLQRAFGEKNAGGHMQAAGGQIPLGILGATEDKDELMALVEKEVVKRFFTAVGAPELEKAPEEKPSRAREKPEDGAEPETTDELHPPRANGAPSPRRRSTRRARVR